MKIIKEHYVWGRNVKVTASDELEARIKVNFITSDYIWEISTDKFNPKLWIAYVAQPQDCFAVND